MEYVFSTGNSFMILIFIKAFNIFYAKDRSNLEILQDMVERIQILDRNGEHPWELIYKNLYECILKQKANLKIEDYIELREKALLSVEKADVTIKMIQMNAKMTFLKEEENCEDYFAIDVLNEYEIKTGMKFCPNIQEMTFEELKEYLDTKITYAYR